MQVISIGSSECKRLRLKGCIFRIHKVVPKLHHPAMVKLIDFECNSRKLRNERGTQKLSFTLEDKVKRGTRTKGILIDRQAIAQMMSV